MKRLTDSAIFKQVAMNASVTKTINEINVQRDMVPFEKIEDPLKIIEKRTKFATKLSVMNHLNSNNIIPVLNPLHKMPKYMHTFGRAVNGKPVFLVDISQYASTDREISNIEIYPKTLYALLQSASVYHEFYHNWNRYTVNATIIKNGSISYSRMVNKILDKQFAVNVDSFRSDLTSFVVAKFFLTNMCDKTDNDTIDNIAYNSCFNKSTFQLILSAESDLMGTDGYTDIFTLFDKLKELKGMAQLNVRSFIENWVRMYGESTLLAIDYLPAFMSTIFSSVVNGNIAKDYIIESVAGKFINPTYLEYGRISK